jgi:hypothetical protein
MCLVVYHARGLSPTALAADPAFITIVNTSHTNSPTRILTKAVKEMLGLRIPIHTLSRARNIVLGNKAEQARNELADIGALLAAYSKLNPRAVIDLDVNARNELLRWFLAFDNTGLSDGLLPILFCDGAHTKNPVCKGVILVISALTTERELVILAIAFVQNESFESWTYMFSMFSRTAMGQCAVQGLLVLMSDRDGGLRAAGLNVFPRANQRYCIVHIIKNAKKARAGPEFHLLVKLAKAGSLWERDKVWMDLQHSSPKTVSWLQDSGLHDFQYQAAPLVARGIPCFGIVTSNPAESANSMMNRSSHDALPLRHMTPASMCREAMKLYSSQANNLRDRSLQLSRFHSSFTKSAVQLFLHQQRESRHYDVQMRGIDSYLVSRRGTSAMSRHVCHTSDHSWWCDCCFHLQFRIMCRHMLAVLCSKSPYNRHRLLQHGGIGDMWSKANYTRAFGLLQVPFPSIADEESCLQQGIFPRNVRLPPPVRQRGRPRKLRFKSFSEGHRAAAIRRAGMSAATRGVVCSLCGEFGHNIRRCKILYEMDDD